MDSKPWWRSRTVWTNLVIWAISAVIALVEVLTGNILPISPEVQGFIVLSVLTVVNLVLRKLTGKPLDPAILPPALAPPPADRPA